MSSKCSCCCYEECFDVKDFVSVYFSSGNVLVPQWYTYNTWQWIVKWLNQRTNNRNKKNEPTSYKSKLWYFIFWWNRYFRWFVITRNVVIEPCSWRPSARVRIYALLRFISEWSWPEGFCTVLWTTTEMSGQLFGFVFVCVVSWLLISVPLNCD